MNIKKQLKQIATLENEVLNNPEIVQHFHNVQHTIFGRPKTPQIKSEAEQILKTVGWIEALTFVNDYLDPYKYPLITGDKRQEWFLNRMTKVKDRYFDTIR